MNLIGIMQGRIYREPFRPLQSFPWETWEQEFFRARALGFDCLEWLFDREAWERNPIWTEAGRRRLRELIRGTGVAVPTLCAHYFIDGSLLSPREPARTATLEIMTALIGHAASVGVRVLVVPLLEEAGLDTPARRRLARQSLRACLPALESAGVSLALETDLPGPEMAAFLEEVGHPGVGVCFDTGNAAALGYNPGAEVRQLKPWLAEVHIKDRLYQGPSVPLGEGAVDFAAFFPVLADLGYEGPIILETQTGEDAENMARRHRDFVAGHLERARERRRA